MDASVAAETDLDNVQITELNGGLRVVSERIPSVRSVALGYWIEAGSCLERPDQAGYSHLIEHLLFRGTDSFSSAQIDQIFDGIGAEVNAATGREATSIYARFMSNHLERICEVVGEMVWRPTLAEVHSERDVVLEEIAMYEDDPQDLIFDLFNAELFTGHPLAAPVVGTRDVIAQAESKGLRELHSACYQGSRAVVAAAGSLQHSELVELVKQQLPEQQVTVPAPLSSPKKPPPAQPAFNFVQRDIEQFHTCIGVRSVGRRDPRRFALQLLDGMLGGNSSSRLFRRIREESGLAYSVSTFSTQYADTGQFGIYLATRAENLKPALEILRQELEAVAQQPPTEDELIRAKESIKGHIALSLESTGARMSRLGSATLFDLPLLTVDELFERIDQVKANSITELAAELLGSGIDQVAEQAASSNSPNYTVVGVGPDSQLFKEATAAFVEAD